MRIVTHVAIRIIDTFKVTATTPSFMTAKFDNLKINNVRFEGFIRNLAKS